MFLFVNSLLENKVHEFAEKRQKNINTGCLVNKVVYDAVYTISKDSY